MGVPFGVNKQALPEISCKISYFELYDEINMKEIWMFHFVIIPLCFTRAFSSNKSSGADALIMHVDYALYRNEGTTFQLQVSIGY